VWAVQPSKTGAAVPLCLSICLRRSIAGSKI
jgi:hypothetical protein